MLIVKTISMIKLSLEKLAHRTVEHSTVLDGKRYAF